MNSDTMQQFMAMQQQQMQQFMAMASGNIPVEPVQPEVHEPVISSKIENEVTTPLASEPATWSEVGIWLAPYHDHKLKADRKGQGVDAIAKHSMIGFGNSGDLPSITTFYKGGDVVSGRADFGKPFEKLMVAYVAKNHAKFDDMVANLSDITKAASVGKIAVMTRLDQLRRTAKLGKAIVVSPSQKSLAPDQTETIAEQPLYATISVRKRTDDETIKYLEYCETAHGLTFGELHDLFVAELNEKMIVETENAFYSKVAKEKRASSLRWLDDNGACNCAFSPNKWCGFAVEHNLPNLYGNMPPIKAGDFVESATIAAYDSTGRNVVELSPLQKALASRPK